jgi:hypothetical protein
MGVFRYLGFIGFVFFNIFGDAELANLAPVALTNTA